MDLSFPIGRFEWKGPSTPGRRDEFINDIAETPNRLKQAIAGLSDEQLNTPYRPGGWTVRQVVHHVPESHMNSYIRFKLALTEDQPTIKPYDEARWAELPDVQSTPLEVSLTLLASLHERWVNLLRSLTEQDFARKFNHPEIGIITLDRNLALYSWHGKHHVAHITTLRDCMNWK